MIVKCLLTVFVMIIMIPWVQSTFGTPELWSDATHSTLTMGWVVLCILGMYGLFERIWRGR